MADESKLAVIAMGDDGPRLPEVEARDRRALWGSALVGVAFIVFALVWLATHLEHPVQPLVLVPFATGVPRVGHILWVLNNRRRQNRD